MPKNIVAAIPLSTFDVGTITANYQAVNGAELPQPCFKLRIMNVSNATITLSYNGVNDHEVILANSTFDIETQMNSRGDNHVALFAIGTKIYIKSDTAMPAGALYISAYYQPNIV